MGKEASCRARHNGTSGAGRLQLETDQLVFRGDFRLVIPLGQVQSAQVTKGTLRVAWAAESAEFELGESATRWLDAIANPKSLLDKLGVKPEHKIAVFGVADSNFLADLQRRTPGITIEKAVTGADIIFFQADQPAQLDELKRLARLIQPAGAIWVITPKKRPEIADTVVMKAGKAAGLVDPKENR